MIRKTPLLIALFVALLLVSPVANGSDDDTGEHPDTTKVREVPEVKKTTGEILADIPGEIIKTPVRIVKGVTSGVIHGVFRTPVRRLLKFNNPFSPFFVVGGYGSNSGLKGGMGYRAFNLFSQGDRLKFTPYYSTNDYQSYKVAYTAPEIIDGKADLRLYFRYKKRPRDSFYGLGNNSLEDKEASFTLENTEFRSDVMYRLSDKVHMGFNGGYTITNIYDGRDEERESDLDVIMADPDFGLTPGQLAGSRYWTIGFKLDLDYRDHPGQPSAGGLLAYSFNYNKGTGRSDDLKFRYNRLDYSHYLNIWKKRILAARVLLQRFNVDNDDVVATPFYLTSSLGGISSLRGYRGNRFIDNDMAFVSLEYRYPVWTVIDAFIFLDEGRVYEDMTDSRFFSDWKYSAGFGMRFWGQSGASLVALVARSDESTKVLFELGASW